MTERGDLQAQFIQSAGWGKADIRLLAGDASNRRYDRLTSGQKRAILMDAPPEKGENVRPFVRIAGFLRSCGLSAPEILAADEDNGFLIIEDLGDALYAREIANRPELEPDLYAAAVDVLTVLNRAPNPLTETFSADITVPLAALAFDWYQVGVSGHSDGAAKADFVSVFHDILKPLDDQPAIVIQRDFHAENLLWLPDRNGPARVGLLDFQDAMSGHPAYDLVSVLQDARRDVTPDTADAMVARYIAQNGFGADDFAAAYAILGTQRNLRILGVFSRLCLRDGKSHYVDLIPRVWDHLTTCLQHPALEPVRLIIERTLPEPGAANLAVLKSKCASCRDL